MGRQRLAVVGGGIVGCAVARRLVQLQPDADVTLLEKEPVVGAHQTGHNSGVVHAGLYYTPGSLKARLCRRGVTLLQEFCTEHSIDYRECGKVVVALDAVEEQRLQDIHGRATANGVPGVRLVGRGELSEMEPNVRGRRALHSPRTAIVDYTEVTRRLAEDARAKGVKLQTSYEVTRVRNGGREVMVGSAYDEQAYDLVISCAGLQSDRVAALTGVRGDARIVPFRGDYFLLAPQRRDVVSALVYPVPDPRYPFLGVHLTPRIDGEIMLGPNAVLALAREGYGRGGRVSRPDVWSTLSWPGFYRFAAKHWRTGARELWQSAGSRAFLKAARRYVPSLKAADLVPGPSGIRAQAMGRDGSLIDDFLITRAGQVVSVRNAPSPGATSSLAIAEHIVSFALEA